jgi:hypothetical protein
MKRENHDSHDKVLDETHAYTFLREDPNIGNISDGFMTDRMKNTAFVPASAVQKLKDGNFQQKFELIIMDDSSLFAEIFVYLLIWNDSDPKAENVIL